MPESAPPRRFRASIGEIMGLVALVALACVWPGLIPTQVVAVLVWFGATRATEGARGRRISLGVVLAAVYLPALANFVAAPLIVPILAGAPDWGEAWSRAFPFAPGTLPAFLVFGLTGIAKTVMGWHPGLEVIVWAVLASLATAAEVYALTLLAGRSRTRRIVAGALGLLVSALGAYLLTLLLTAG